MLDRMIIDHASPTLARLKMGNLFNHTMGEGFPIEFAELCRQLQDKGVTMKCKSVYQKLFASGCPLSRLTVAARPA